MEKKRIKDLNNRQRSWLYHLKKCAASGRLRCEYAKEHGLNYSTFERMRNRLGMLGVWSEPDREFSATPSFQKVAISSLPSRYESISLTMPNGVVVLIAGGLDSGCLGEILDMAARIQ